MKQLPKVVRERLAAGTGAAGRNAAMGATHLDANLVSAFVEQALLPAERRGIFDHLAICAECRAEVRLVQGSAGPGGAPQAARAQGFSGQSWWRWMLCWETSAAGAAAALAIVAVWVSLRPPPRGSSSLNSVIARNAGAAPNPSLPEQNDRPEVNTPKPVPLAELRPQSGAMSKRERVPAYSVDAHLPKVDSDQLTSAAGPSGLPIPDRERSAVPPPSAPSPLSASGGITPSPPAKGSLMAGKPPASPEKPLEIYVDNAASAAATSTVAAKAFSERKLMAVHPAGASLVESDVRWAISRSAVPGTLEQSRDGGRTWQAVLVASSVQLHAVFALGRDVWAGGAGGALFHSKDGGGQWSAVRVAGAGATLKANIVGMQFADQAHGLVTAANGERWATSDGGQSWDRQP